MQVSSGIHLGFDGNKKPPAQPILVRALQAAGELIQCV